MRIFIGTDSRGTSNYMEDCWVRRFEEKYARKPGFELTVLCSLRQCDAFSIYSVDPYLIPFKDNEFNIAFIQTGINERVGYWPIDTYERIIPKHFNKEKLRNKNEVLGEKDRYSYKDIDTERKMFGILKEKCQIVVFIGIHSVKQFSPRSKMIPPYYKNALELNEDFSEMAGEYISLPMDEKWAKDHTHDFMHYNVKGIQYMMERVESYL